MTPSGISFLIIDGKARAIYGKNLTYPILSRFFTLDGDFSCSAMIKAITQSFALLLTI